MRIIIYDNYKQLSCILRETPSSWSHTFWCIDPDNTVDVVAIKRNEYEDGAKNICIITNAHTFLPSVCLYDRVMLSCSA